MTTSYTKKINISLTEEDFDYIKIKAAKDRRSAAQYVSLLVEEVVKCDRSAMNNTETETNTNDKH